MEIRLGTCPLLLFLLSPRCLRRSAFGANFARFLSNTSTRRHIFASGPLAAETAACRLVALSSPCGPTNGPGRRGRARAGCRTSAHLHRLSQGSGRLKGLALVVEAFGRLLRELLHDAAQQISEGPRPLGRLLRVACGMAWNRRLGFSLARVARVWDSDMGVRHDGPLFLLRLSCDGRAHEAAASHVARHLVRVRRRVLTLGLPLVSTGQKGSLMPRTAGDTLIYFHLCSCVSQLPAKIRARAKE